MQRTYSNILVAVDGSYFLYFSIFSAIKKWAANSPNAIILKPANETDQENLPNLTKYSDFCRTLEQAIAKKITDVDNLITKVINEDEEIDTNVVCLHKIFALDSPINSNWRKKLFPQYKAQRKIMPKQCDMGAIMDYVENLLKNKMKLTDLNYHPIRVTGAEGDDILATVLSELNDYDKKILIASDRDFLQLDGIDQYDLFGSKKEILAKLQEETKQTISPAEYLVLKSIIGDVADNIPGVFNGVGEKRALKLIKNKSMLIERLRDNLEAAKQFKLNRTIIGFDFIPKTLKETILEKVRPFLEEDKKNQVLDDFSNEDLIAL